MDLRTNIDRHGRLLIPVVLRKLLNYQPNDNFVLRAINGELHVLKLEQVVTEVQDIVSQYLNPSVHQRESMLDEFLQMRREEFVCEESKFQERK
jgi:bifunctional DNA-binding transcriptional regulator/antitoxin component of YhaV-PrlF toxin-antitoxin module